MSGRGRNELPKRPPRHGAHRRRRWAAFLVFLACLLGLLALTYQYPPEEEPVSRVKLPAMRSEPAPSQHIRQARARSLRTRLEETAAEYPGSYGVVVHDPSSGKTVALDADERFAAASLTKLPVLFTLYRAAARGEVDLEDEISMLRSDVQAYGTGVLYKYPVGYTITVRECAELMIRESDNTAWVMLDRYLGRHHVEAELDRIGATSTEYWNPNTTTPNDVLIMLKTIADPSYTTPELSAEMLDVMTDTSFEDRLPEPLPEGTRVAHKIGSYHDTFSDAGIVFPRGSNNTRDAYFIVVMAADTTEQTARSAIQDMSLTTYRSLGELPPTPGRRQDRPPESRP
jgi:beta-lactamase class A